MLLFCIISIITSLNQVPTSFLMGCGKTCETFLYRTFNAFTKLPAINILFPISIRLLVAVGLYKSNSNAEAVSFTLAILPVISLVHISTDDINSVGLCIVSMSSPERYFNRNTATYQNYNQNNSKHEYSL